MLPPAESFEAPLRVKLTWKCDYGMAMVGLRMCRVGAWYFYFAFLLSPTLFGFAQLNADYECSPDLQAVLDNVTAEVCDGT
jgi:hypothetical protein